MKKQYIAAIIALVFSAQSQAGLFGDTTYDIQGHGNQQEVDNSKLTNGMNNNGMDQDQTLVSNPVATSSGNRTEIGPVDNKSGAEVGDITTQGGQSDAKAGAAAGAGAAADAKQATDTKVSTETFTNNKTKVHTTYIPPIAPVPPSIVAGATVQIVQGACGPLMVVKSEPVQGTFHGLFVDSKVDQGTTDTLVPYVDKDNIRHMYREVITTQGNTHYYGSQVTTFVTVVGVAGARQLGIGGGSGSGSFGQAGLGSSSSNQRMVIKHMVSDCDAGALVGVHGK